MEMTTEQYIEKSHKILTILQNRKTEIPLDSILEELGYLELAAKQKAAEAGQEADRIEILIEKNIDQVNNYYQEMKKKETIRGKLEIEYVKLSEQLKQDEIALNSYESILATLDIQLKGACTRQREASIQLQKWCWVPGYGIYLLLEYQEAVDNLKNQIDNQVGHKNTLERQISQLKEEKKELDNNRYVNRQQVKELQEKISLCKKEQDSLLIPQKELRESLLQWKTQNLYFRLLQDKLSGYKTIMEITGEASEEIMKIVSQTPATNMLATFI